MEEGWGGGNSWERRKGNFTQDIKTKVTTTATVKIIKKMSPLLLKNQGPWTL